MKNPVLKKGQEQGNMENKNYTGHFTAALTILIWGTTFISTKVLLEDFQPVEILVFRFILGFVILLLLSPRRLKTKGKGEELLFVGAGLSGICLYYLLENIALTYTLASNVGVIISVAPFFTAILAHLFLGTVSQEEKLGIPFFIGFFLAMAGIILISFNGAELKLNPAGDLLALVWAVYSVLSRKISSLGYPVVLTTRRTFFYGLLFMIPASFLLDFQLNVAPLLNPVNLLNILYLGAGASALCFVTWNFSVKKLGAVKTSIYIYLVPVITVVTSALILHEQMGLMSALGVLLTLAGLGLSEIKWKRKSTQ